MSKIFEELGINDGAARLTRTEVWDGAHILELVFKHSMEGTDFDEIRRTKDMIQAVTTFFR